MNRRIEQNKLTITLKDEVLLKKVGKKPCIKLSFHTKEESRLFPLETFLNKIDDSVGLLIGKASIFLPFVFLREVKEEVRVQPELFFEGRREPLGEAFFLEASLFQNNQKERERITSAFMLPFAFLSVPPFLLLAVMKGKKGREAIKFANSQVKKNLGVSFSVREFKTNYFKKQYLTFSSLPIQKKSVLFLSERRVEKGGNLFLIKEALKQRQDLSVRTFLAEKTVDKLSFRELRESARLIATSKIIVLEDFYPQLHALTLRKETKVIQLWHACGVFKTFGFSRLGRPGGPEEYSRNHRNYDRAFVSGEAIIPYYSEAFAIPEKNILPLGVPRTDIFFEEAYKSVMQKRWRETYPMLDGKRIVLFAPTFRGQGNKDAFYPSEAFSVEEFMETMPKDVVLILKQHPFVTNTISIPEVYRDRVFDFSKKESLNDLLFITSLFITDYSSSVFEAALLELPMLFYVFDEETYMAERDVYEDFDSFIPGKKARNFEELLSLASQLLREKEVFSYDMKRFRDFYLSALDGRSTARIADDISALAEEERA